MANIILASHGELAKGMKHSATMIIGDFAEEIEVFCLCPGMNPEDYAKEMKEKIASNQEEYVFICDILGGSVHTALSQLMTNKRVSVLSGMNLNLVLSIALANQNVLTKEAIETALAEAKEGLTYKTTIEEAADEDF